MQKLYIASALLLALGAAAQAPPAQTPAQPASPSTLAQSLEQPLSIAEKEFVSAAEAMPEEKYEFVPAQGEFKGVRTFAQQVKHVAAANYGLGGFVLGEKPPVDMSNMNGPDAIKTKADILKFLKDSYAYAHKAVASISEQNATKPEKSPFGSGNTTRLAMATFAVAHTFDHYGQIVVYLRMNGIVPPASRKQD